MQNGKWLFIIARKIEKMLLEHTLLIRTTTALGRRTVVEIVSDEEQNIQEAHSPALIESCTFGQISRSYSYKVLNSA